MRTNKRVGAEEKGKEARNAFSSMSFATKVESSSGVKAEPDGISERATVMKMEERSRYGIYQDT